LLSFFYFTYSWRNERARIKTLFCLIIRCDHQEIMIILIISGKCLKHCHRSESPLRIRQDCLYNLVISDQVHELNHRYWIYRRKYTPSKYRIDIIPIFVSERKLYLYGFQIFRHRGDFRCTSSIHRRPIKAIFKQLGFAYKFGVDLS